LIKRSLLGTAFAAADLIFEVDAVGKVTFALGSTSGLAVKSNGALEGQNWRNLFCADDQNLLAALLRSVQGGERKGPMKVVLATDGHNSPGRAAMFSVFRLPDLGAETMSCALAFGGVVAPQADASASHDLAPAEDFPAAAKRLLQEAEQAGLQLQVDLIQVDGLAASDAKQGLRSRVAATLRANSLNGEGAAELAPDRFAVVRSANQAASDFQAQLEEAAGATLKPVMASMPLSAGSIDENLRALRYALDQYIGAGDALTSIDFGAIVQKTAAETARLKTALSAHAWQLVYQPVVKLENTDRLHHFEALVRFEAGASPQGAVYLAEELGLIVDFDLDVAKRVAKVLADDEPKIKIAVNVSASSLMQPAFLSALAKITEKNTRLRPRLLLEITETQKLTDLPAADKAIQALRRLGHPVCLDDFGAGAASLDYLRQLDVDFVKFDGRYLQSLKAHSRDEVVLRHMVNLCRELRIETIAEMIETPETAKLAQSIGVGLGQGWCFAKPGADLVYPPKDNWQPARRKGEVESWS
jgi:EAL domain-containing protein (putative c-di-GMP-specific phosphodiesterase class I)